MAQFHLFLPQMRMEFAALVERAQAAEAGGFDGLAVMDHLAPPMAEQHTMFDAMITAAWVGANTTTLRIGHLVLCDAFRHPAVLAKQAVSLDHATGGRFELGIGWGSVPDEFGRFGIGTTDAPTRVERLRETLDVLTGLWTGEPFDYEGTHHRLQGAQQQPTPLGGIPLLIGGGGPKTLRLVAEHADWWNCPTYALERLDELRDNVGAARVSTQQQIAFVPRGADRGAIEALTRRRFGPDPLVATGDELVDHFRKAEASGVERFYVWFTDFAPPSTLAAFGDEVISAMAG